MADSLKSIDRSHSPNELVFSPSARRQLRNDMQKFVMVRRLCKMMVESGRAQGFVILRP